jgi:cephalosporin hydroxylase
MLDRIVFVKGDSISNRVISKIREYTGSRRGLVMLDFLHAREHVLKELKLYSSFVLRGSCIIVNDTHLEMMSIMDAGSGPMRAIKNFLEATKEFTIDPDLRGAVVSCAPSGFLTRIAKTSFQLLSFLVYIILLRI